MGSKVKCPACGAKNDATSYRCRMCTVVINADAVDAAPDESVAEAAPRVDHFDAGVIDRQLQPTRSKFSDDAGGLAARLAAARAAKAANQPTAPGGTTSTGPVMAPNLASAAPPGLPGSPGGPSAASTASAAAPPPSPDAPDAPFEPVDLSELQARTAPPTAPPIEHEAEPFDPDALFRDMS
jgi:hypothetical protein